MDPFATEVDSPPGYDEVDGLPGYVELPESSDGDSQPAIFTEVDSPPESGHVTVPEENGEGT
jgi:hypothetical protein